MSTGFKLNKIYRTGYCVGRGALAERSRGWKKVRFYARSFLLEHPKKGVVLVDTGYGRPLVEACQRGIYSLYSKILPFTYRSQDSVVTQLAQDGIALSDLSYLLITHFHPDHIGALPEFANVPWIYRKEALEGLLKLSILGGLKKGFIRTLVPAVPKGSIPIVETDFKGQWNSFASIDLFGDGSLYLIDLPGHAVGQMGVGTQDYFLVADARWGTDEPPNKLGFFLQEDAQAYRKTFDSLLKLPSSLQIIPTHTIETHA